jgi:hypothetical protein
LSWRFLALSPPGLLLATLSGVAQPEPDCVQFGSKRLSAGSSFTYALPRGLEVRIPFAGNGWRIVVGPRDDRAADFLAPVSPPFRSAPHLAIGSAYGVPARESIAVTPRRLRFVLNRHDAQAARDIGSAALLGDMSRWKQLDTLGTGTITVNITDGEADDEIVEWFAFTAEACVP